MASRNDPAHAVLARQRAASDKLRREVLGTDGSLSYPYFRGLRRQLRAFRRPVELDTLFDACREADLVYVGDFHAVPAFQEFAAELLTQVARGKGEVGFGIEFIYTRQQRLLDRRQAGLIDDETFLRRIHYREEWGYPWSGFRRVLDAAREQGIRVFALDSAPRGGFGGLRRRDDHAARNIAGLVRSAGVDRLVVLYGESHLSRDHIPHKVATRLARTGHEARQISVFQDPDEVYWRLASNEGPVPRAVQIDDATYAVFHGNPLTKYEAYRQVLERWREDVPAEEEVDLTPAVHHLLAVLLGYLEIEPSRFRLHHRGGWSEDLTDAFPEIYSGPDGQALLPDVLAEHDRTPEEIDESGKRLVDYGALYDSRSNSMFLTRYLPGRAAGEGTRFLRAALSGRLFHPPVPWDDPAARAYGAAYDEGLAVLGMQLVDPTGEWLGSPGVGLPESPDGETLSCLEEHHRFELCGGSRPPARLAEALRVSRPLRRALARDLGARLGRRLFQRVRTGDLQARGLRHLFRRGLSQANARRVILQLLRQS